MSQAPIDGGTINAVGKWQNLVGYPAYIRWNSEKSCWIEVFSKAKFEPWAWRFVGSLPSEPKSCSSWTEQDNDMAKEQGWGVSRDPNGLFFIATEGGFASHLQAEHYVRTMHAKNWEAARTDTLFSKAVLYVHTENAIAFGNLAKERANA